MTTLNSSKPDIQLIEIHATVEKLSTSSSNSSSTSKNEVTELLPPPYSKDHDLITPVNSHTHGFNRHRSRLHDPDSKECCSDGDENCDECCERCCENCCEDGGCCCDNNCCCCSRRCKWIAIILVLLPFVIAAVLGGFYATSSGRCSALDATTEQVKIYTFDGSKYPKQYFDFKTHGIYVKSTLRFSKSSNLTGTISLRTASLGTVTTPSQTLSNDYLFRVDSSDNIFSFFSFLSTKPSCMAVIADISLPVGNYENLAVGNSYGSMSFTNLAEAVYNNVAISTDNGGIIIDGAFGAKTADISSNNGDLTISNVQSPELSLKLTANNGGIVLNNMRSSSLNIESRNGKVEANSANVAAFVTKSNNGKVDITSWSGKSITITNNNGGVDVTIPTITDKVIADINSNNGGVKLDVTNNFHGNLDLQSKSEVQVTGQGLSDIRYSISESNRKIGYKSTADPTSVLKIQTQNGDVALKFI